MNELEGAAPSAPQRLHGSSLFTRCVRRNFRGAWTWVPVLTLPLRP